MKWVVAGVFFLLLLGAVTMFLWNWLVPALFNGPQIGFIQALGLLLLSKILFSGWGGHRCRTGGAHAWKHRYYEKLASMSPEERERFKSRMREKWCTAPEMREPKQDTGNSNV